jgi:tetratricopeptide (TPR) repeat protein
VHLGSGKTTLVKQYMSFRSSVGSYDTVKALRMSHDSQKDSLRDWARSLDLPWEFLNVFELWQSIMAALGSQRWLLLFDDVEGFWTIDELLRHAFQPGQHIIITTADETITENRIHIGAYDDAEALSYVQKQMKTLGLSGYTEPAAKTLASSMRLHPLLLELALGYMRCTKRALSMTEFCEKHLAGICAVDSNESKDEPSVLSIARSLLRRVIKFLSVDSKQLLVFLACIDKEGAEIVTVKWFFDDSNPLLQFIDIFRDSGLLKCTSVNSFSMHELVQEACRRELRKLFGADSRDWVPLLRRCYAVLAAVCPEECVTSSDCTALAHVSEHAQRMLMRVTALSMPDWVGNSDYSDWLIHMWALCGHVKYLLGDYGQAESDLNSAIRVFKNRFEDSALSIETTVSVARVFRDLALVAQQENNLRGASAHSGKAIQMLTDVFGTSDNVDVARALYVLGEVQSVLGDSAKAISNLSDAMQMFTAIYGDSSQCVAFARCELALAFAHESAGDLQLAKEIAERALVSFRALYGQNANRSELAIALFVLGNIYSKMLDSKAASEYLEPSLHMLRTMCACKTHPCRVYLGRTLQCIADIYYNRADPDLELALSIYLEALQVYRSLFNASGANNYIASTLKMISLVSSDIYLRKHNSITHFLGHFRVRKLKKELRDAPLSSATDVIAAVRLAAAGGRARYDSFSDVLNFEVGLGVSSVRGGASVWSQQA